MTSPAATISQHGPPGQKSRRLLAALAVLIVASALFVGLWQLATPDWGIDEVFYRDAGNAYLLGDYTVNPEHPPLAKQIIGIAQRVLGETIWAVRLPSVLLALATGLVLYGLGRRMGGPVAGIAAGTIWLLLPIAPPPMEISITRYGMLEPAMVLFASFALYCAWRWGEDGEPRWAAAAGAALGLAVAAKLPAVLFFPAVLLPMLWTPADDRRRIRGTTLLIAGLAAGYLLPLLPAGSEALNLAVSPVSLQAGHAEAGHTVMVAGAVFERPPWWSHLWWMIEQRGIAASIGIAVSLVGLFFLSAPKRALSFLAAAVLVPLVTMSLFTVKLPHYHIVWAAPLALAAGLGIAAWWQRGGHYRIGALSAAFFLVVAMAGTAVKLLSVERSNYAAAAEFLEERGLDAQAIGFAGWPGVAAQYLERPDLVREPDGPTPVVIIDPHIADRFPDLAPMRIVAENPGLYRRHDFGRIQVYVRK